MDDSAPLSSPIRHQSVLAIIIIDFEKPTCHFLPRPIEKVLMAEPQLCDLALIETEIIESIKNSQKDSFKACFEIKHSPIIYDMVHMI